MNDATLEEKLWDLTKVSIYGFRHIHTLKDKGDRQYFERLLAEGVKSGLALALYLKACGLMDHNNPMPDEAKQLLLQAARAGDMISQKLIADEYNSGRLLGIWENIHWHEVLAARNVTYACAILGEIHERGHWDGLPQDYAKARSWYRRAVDEGRAQFRLGEMYLLGIGGCVDGNLAAVHFEIAAKVSWGPDLDIVLRVSRLFAGESDVLPRSAIDAARILETLIVKPDNDEPAIPCAMVDLALLLERGIGVQKNRRRALVLFNEAISRLDGLESRWGGQHDERWHDELSDLYDVAEEGCARLANLESTQELASILAEIDRPELIDIFVKSAIDDSLLSELTDEDLRVIGVSELGIRKKLLKKCSER